MLTDFNITFNQLLTVWKVVSRSQPLFSCGPRAKGSLKRVWYNPLQNPVLASTVVVVGDNRSEARNE